MAVISIMGMYLYDKTLFEKMIVPVGIDHDFVQNVILYQCAELEIVYPNPHVMKKLIGLWSAKHLYKWDELLKTTQYSYDPIENYNRKEKWSITASGSGESVGKTVGFDSGNLVVSNGSDSTVSNNEERSGVTSGNIGVTTTQKMIQEQRDIVNFDIIQIIVDDFKRDFCIQLY